MPPNNSSHARSAFTLVELLVVIAIGRNQIDGHSGHHEMVVLPGRRDAVISNPADATLLSVSLTDFQIDETLSVAGTPARLISIGD